MQLEPHTTPTRVDYVSSPSSYIAPSFQMPPLLYRLPIPGMLIPVSYITRVGMKESENLWWPSRDWVGQKANFVERKTGGRKLNPGLPSIEVWALEIPN